MEKMAPLVEIIPLVLEMEGAVVLGVAVQTVVTVEQEVYQAVEVAVLEEVMELVDWVDVVK